jgi:hypothetical protein
MRSKLDPWRTATLVCVALAAIFLIPKLFLTAPSISASYAFGYNNRVGTLVLLAVLLLGTFLFRTDFVMPSRDSVIPKSLIRRWMMIFAVGWAAMTAFDHGFGGFGESAYLIDRLNLVAKGAVPYRDFEFAYGPALLYLPRIFMLFHLSAEHSYAIFWLLTLLTGVWLLSQTLTMIRFPSAHKADIFKLLCTFALISVLTTGTNYTFFRFMPGPYLALIVDRSYGTGSGRSRVAPFTAILLATMILMLISPEISLAFVMGCVAYCVLLEADWSIGIASQYVGLLASLAVVFYFANRLGMFYTLKMFSGGAYNFPILPAGHLLLFFFMCMLVALYVAEALRAKQGDRSLLFVIAASAATLFAALGRCDPGHVGFAAAGIVLAASLLASDTPLWKTYRACFIVFFLILPTVSGVWLYKGLLRSAVSADRHLQARSFPQNVKAPFAYSPNHLGMSQAGVDEGYFDGVVNVFTQDAVDRKIGEISGSPSLLIPEDFKKRCTFNPMGERKLIELLFVLPYFAHPKHVPETLEPLCTYIEDHYTKSKSVGYEYDVWTAK